MADQHQGQDKLPQPSLGDRQVEKDVVGSTRGCEGFAESLLGGVNLLIEELPADLVLPGQLGDRFSPGEHLDGQALPLLRQQSLGGTRNTDRDRTGRDWAGDRREIALRGREVRSSLTIHVCFLRETVFVRTNNPNMEETGSLENPILSGKCYLELNRAGDVRSLLGITHHRSRRCYESHATEKKTTNLARGPSSTAFCLLETRLRGFHSRSCIRERLSRTRNPRKRLVSPEGLEASRLPSFERTIAREDRCFFLRCYRNPW